jgi:hypothetical protein
VAEAVPNNSGRVLSNRWLQLAFATLVAVLAQLCAPSADAQPIPSQPPLCTPANLGVSCGVETNGFIARVTTALNTTSCTLGGGTEVNLCQYKAATDTWEALRGAGGGGLSDGDKGDVILSGSATVWDLDELDAESELEAVLDAPQLQGYHAGTSVAADLEEEGHASEHEPGAADPLVDLAYVPNALAEWPGSADPGNVDDALNALAASRVDFQSGTTDDPNGSVTCTTAPCLYLDTNGRAIAGSNPTATTGVPVVWRADIAGSASWAVSDLPVEPVSKYAKAYPTTTTGGIQEAVTYGCPSAVSGAGRYACLVLVDVPDITLTDPVRVGMCSSSSLQYGVLIAGLKESFGTAVPATMIGRPTIRWNGTETGQLATMFQFACSFHSGLANLSLLMDEGHDGTNYARIGVRLLAHRTTGLAYEQNWSSGHVHINKNVIWGSDFQQSGGAGGPAGANCPGTKNTCQIGVLKDSTAPFDDGAAVAEQTGQTISVTKNADGSASYRITAGGGNFGSYSAGDWISFNTAFVQGRNEGTFQVLTVTTQSTANDTATVWHPYAITEAAVGGVAFAEPNHIDADFAYSIYEDNHIKNTDVAYWIDTSQGVNDIIRDGELGSNRRRAVRMERGQMDLEHVGMQGPTGYAGYEHVERSTNGGVMFRWLGGSVEHYTAGQTALHLVGSGSSLESVHISGVRFQTGVTPINWVTLDSGHQAAVLMDQVRLETGIGAVTYNLNLNGGAGSSFSLRQAVRDSSVTISPTIAANTVVDCESVDSVGRHFDTDCDLTKDAAETYFADLADRTKAVAVTGAWDFSGALLTTADIDEATLDDDLLAFDDADSLWTATQLGPALEELNDSINAGVPNGAGSKVHWSQLLGVPAGFTDGTDDGGGGGSSALDLGDNGVNESGGITEIATINDNATNPIVTEPAPDKALFDFLQVWPGGSVSLWDTDTATEPYIWLHSITGDLVLNPAKTSAQGGTPTGTFQARLLDTTACWEYEGSSADAHELLDCIVNPTGDTTWNRPDLAAGTYTYATLEASQTFATGTKTVTAKFDFGGGTLELPNSTTLPGTCVVGEAYFDSDATVGQNFYGCTATNTWTLQGDGGGGGGAPTGVNYLVGTADGTLSNEIVVGASPGGELGGTWASPTIDDSLAVTSWNLTTPIITTSVTFEGGATDPVLTPGSGTLAFTNLTTLTLPSAATLEITNGCSIATAVVCPAVATPVVELEDSTNADADVDFRLAISDNASNDAEASFLVEDAGALVTYLQLDGINQTIVLGAASLTALTLTTDGTGDAEVVLPTGSIGAGEVLDASLGTADLGTDSVNADELNATGVESELEAVLDLPQLQGLLLLAQITDDASAGLCLVSGGAGGDPNWATCPGGGGGTFVDSLYVPAGSMDVDAVQCTKSITAAINSGPMIAAINCADNAAGIVYFELVMPDSWANSGIITVEAQAYTIDATVTGGADDTIGWDVSCMARGDGETINSTWGTAQNLDVTFVTQYVEEHVTSANITPDDFEAGDTLYCRAVVDATTTDATTADMRLKGFKVEFTRALGD